MNLADWLGKERGRSEALASHIGVSKGAISQWKTNGVPVGHMKTVRDITGGAVTLEEMVPEPKGAVTAEQGG
jgi:DNA-binding transcriptional regulator YdaS (Cro superfamily)